jgi:hypothetical protein
MGQGSLPDSLPRPEFKLTGGQKMKIKSLLLGSAAAMAVVSGASAADAIIAAEPEPVEYVRVCDAFGTGYFYIPGTETCLRISGYVWFQVGAQYADYDSQLGDTWTNNTRARVNFDARSDTEWGELAARIRLQGTWGSGWAGSTRYFDFGPFPTNIGQSGTTPFGSNVDGPTTIDQAWIRLGGLFMGYSESYWVDAYNTGPTNFGSHSWGGMSYGYSQDHQIGYTFNTGNFYIAAALENNNHGSEIGVGPLWGNGGGSWTPNFVAKAGGAFGPVNVFAKYGYDASTSNSSAGVGLVSDIGANGNLILYGYWAEGATQYGANYSYLTTALNLPNNANGIVSVTPEWSVLASYQYTFSSTFSASIGGQYFDNFWGTNIDNAWMAELSLVWTPITNFEIRAEGYYFQDSEDNENASGFLRFTRSF